MNSDSANKVITLFADSGWIDTYEHIHGKSDPGYTAHDFYGTGAPPHAANGKIDWIFVRGNFKVLFADIIKDKVKGRYPSDHYFVSAEVDLL